MVAEVISDSRSQWVLGLVSLSAVVVLWVLSSFLINEIFESNIYSKPFFITYINTSIFIFYLLPVFLKFLKLKFIEKKSINLMEVVRKSTEDEVRIKKPVDLELQIETSGLIINNNDSNSDHSSIVNPNNHVNKVTIEDSTPLSLEETIKLSFQFCMLWYLANLTTNSSLIYTSVSSQTILSSTSSFFTLFFGFLFKLDSINRVKLISLFLSFLGIIIITKIDSSSIPNGLNLKDDHYSLAMFIGNLLALLGACFYGAYTVLLKLKVKSQNRLNTKVFFGFVGIFNAIFLWPTLLLLNYTGIEKFELPSTKFVWLIISINCLITFISDYCWAIAVLLTSPLTVTVGLSLTIPLALIGDVVFKGKHLTFGYLIGALIISVSFLMINRDQEEIIVEDSFEE